MIKVLHVVSSMDPVLGGVCKAVRIIASSLIQAGIDNEVVSLDDPEADFVTNETFKLHALGKTNNPWSYHADLLPWLKSNISNYNYVIIHGLWLYNSYAVYKAFKKINETKASKKTTKYFVMPHGMLDPYFQKASGRRLKAARNWLYWKFIEQKVINSAEGLLFTCEEEQQLAKQTFTPYHPKKELIVGLGIDTPPTYHPKMDHAFFDACEGLEKRSFLLFLSRIHEKKGVDLLIEAYKDILNNPSKYLDSNTYDDNQSVKSHRDVKFVAPALVIVGPGMESDYGKTLMKVITEAIELENHIFLPGMLSGDAKWGAFYNSEAFVLPSHQENFGIAVVESLACQKPVLISNQINIWKEINHEKAGLVESDTLLGTIKLLKQWIHLSAEEKTLMGNRAEACYKTYFSAEALVLSWKNKVLNV